MAFRRPNSPLSGDPTIQEEVESRKDLWISLDGNSLSGYELVRLGSGNIKIKLSSDAVQKVNEARTLVENILTENKVYGISTGIGKFAPMSIDEMDRVELQENIIRSHAAGVGDPLTPARTRRLLAIRINVLAKGYSGISLGVLQQYIDAFNASCLSLVPEKGTVGASGDLAPLSHLALGMMGEGKMWSPETGWDDAKYVLESHGLKPIKLGPKEGVALINGTQLITALGVEAVERANNIARQADIVAALTLEALKGTTKAFDGDIQKVRPHKGQQTVAKRLRSVLHSDTYPSEISQSHRFCTRVQDAYSLRCCPQVHGIVNDTIEFVRGILHTEMNSATDNPIVFVGRAEIISGGNFHGEYPAKALDYLAIGVHELANISERRIERLVNPVSESRVLCHPSSVDTMTTSAGTEDHVSMGGFAARKALIIVEHVEQVVAIELLTACQALEFLRPLKSTEPLEEVYKLVRTVVKPLDKDRFMSPDINAVTQLLQEGKIWSLISPLMDKYYNEHESEI